MLSSEPVMSSPRSTPSVPDKARDEAIDWFISFCEGDVNPRRCEAFAAWLRTSPEHVRAYLQVSALWEAAGTLNAARKLQLDELVRRALSDSNTESNIVTLGAPQAGVSATDRMRAV